MSTSFYLMNRSEQTRWLRENHPFAFLLLTVIAERIKWNENYSRLKLEIFQCVIGTTEMLWKGCTRRQLRTAIKTLECCKLVVTKPTSKGTVVTLINSDIVTVRISKKDQHLTNDRPTDTKKTTTNLEYTRKIEGINLPLYFSDNEVIHALAVELKKQVDDIKNLTQAFIKHCGVLKTTYSNNAVFALHRDFKAYAEQQQQGNTNYNHVPLNTPYYK